MSFSLLTTQIIFSFFVFITGACIGSFLNVVIYRVPLGLSVVTPRSHCTACKKQIPIQYLVPILGFFFTRGKSNCCQTPISFSYPLIELLTGMATVCVYLLQPNTIFCFVSLWLLYTGIALSAIDFKYRILPDIIVLPGIFFGIVLSALNPAMGFFAGCAGALFGFLFLFVISKGYQLIRKKVGMGMGDVKYLAFIGAVLGWDGAMLTLFLACFLGSFFGIGVALFQGKKTSLLQISIPFGPFLAAAALLISFYKSWILQLL